MSETLSLSLMIKAPEVGLAKTRLAPALGEEGAARLAAALLADSLETWRDSPCPVTLATTGTFDKEMQQQLSDWPQVPQVEGTLGQRMESVLRHCLREAAVAVVVGTDIPSVGPAQIRETMQLLESHDAVLGPARDGGFYWLALRRCPTGLLDNVSWSCASTCEETRARLAQAGMRVAMLEHRLDVDTPADLTDLGQYLRSNPTSLPRTRAFFASPANRSISVVIPVLNEEKQIGSLLAALREDAPWAETIVVDGGSVDQTVRIARSVPGVVVLKSRAGRAAQLNCGAAAAIGGTLLFLHADARLPKNSLMHIRRALQTGSHVAGAFQLRTSYDSSGHRRPWVRPFLWLADLRSKYTRSPYGDQGLFVRADEFWAVGGYPEQPLFEDLHLSQALAGRRRLAILPGPIVVSGRRFQKRPLYYLALMNSLPLLYRLGVSPKAMASLYPDHR